jgi:cellulose 1,4-beta-cellobiosidase
MQSTGPIHVHINKADGSNFDKTDDYSFDATKTTLTESDKVTLYWGGQLVWGDRAEIGTGV